MKVTIDLDDKDIDLIQKICWLRPLKFAVELLGNSEDSILTDHAQEVEDLLPVENIRNKLVEAIWKASKPTLIVYEPSLEVVEQFAKLIDPWAFGDYDIPHTRTEEDLLRQQRALRQIAARDGALRIIKARPWETLP
jgi:hypothetical protein